MKQENEKITIDKSIFSPGIDKTENVINNEYLYTNISNNGALNTTVTNSDNNEMNNLNNSLSSDNFVNTITSHNNNEKIVNSVNSSEHTILQNDLKEYNQNSTQGLNNTKENTITYNNFSLNNSSNEENKEMIGKYDNSKLLNIQNRVDFQNVKERTLEHADLRLTQLTLDSDERKDTLKSALSDYEAGVRTLCSMGSLNQTSTDTQETIVPYKKRRTYEVIRTDENGNTYVEEIEYDEEDYYTLLTEYETTIPISLEDTEKSISEMKNIIDSFPDKYTCSSINSIEESVNKQKETIKSIGEIMKKSIESYQHNEENLVDIINKMAIDIMGTNK